MNILDNMFEPLCQIWLQSANFKDFKVLGSGGGVWEGGRKMGERQARRTWDLVTKDTQNDELMPSSASSLLIRLVLRCPWEGNSGARNTHGGRRSGQGAFIQTGPTKVHGTWMDTTTSITGAYQCHCEATLDYLWRMAIRGCSQGLEESKCNWLTW